MSINIQSPRVTMAALYAIGGLVFSSGIAWNTILNNADTNTKQWNFINKALAEITAQAKYNSKVDLLVSDLPAYEKSNRELSNSLIALTHELKSSNERQVREKQDKEKQDARLDKVIDDIGEIKIKITRMEAWVKK